MRIADSHTHFFSRDFYRLLAAEAASVRRPSDPGELLEELSRKTGIELPDPDPRKHAARWLSELERHGVERAVSFASLPGEADAVREAAEVTKGRLVPFLAVDPSTEDGIQAAVRALKEGGFRGLLLFPAIHRVDPAAPALDPLYTTAGECRALVVIHCGILEIKVRDLLGIRPRYDLRLASPLHVSAAAEKHPGTSFLIPHFGSGFFREALIAGAQSRNVHLDSSSSNSWMRSQSAELTLDEVFRRSLEVFGPRRILFGTDSSTFPRGWRAGIFDEQRRALRDIGLREPDQARILGENLMELLSLEG